MRFDLFVEAVRRATRRRQRRAATTIYPPLFTIHCTQVKDKKGTVVLKDIILFFPRLIKRGSGALNSKIHLKITTKTALIYGVIYLVIGVLSAFAINAVMTGDINGDALFRLRMTVITVTVITTVFLTLLGRLFSGGLLRPVAKMTRTTKSITAESISARLDDPHTQDELKELAAVINNMLDRLQETLEAQERFVSDASHELRTPISVVQGYAQLLQRWGTADAAIMEESIDAIVKEAANMKSLVDNLLFLSRTNRDVKDLRFENFFINDLVEEIYKDSAVAYPKHIITIGNMEAITLDANREMIKQLIRIIVDNAVRYTPDGGTVKISCTVDEERENGPFAKVETEDTGIGIAANDLPHIFDRFYRADKARTRGDGGSGLGLSIAKKIADSHHAEIIIRSEQGVGTVVTILLPIEGQD